MIAIAISAETKAAIAVIRSNAERQIAADRKYRVRLPRAVVERLRALRGPEETFTDAILRLADRCSLAAIVR